MKELSHYSKKLACLPYSGVRHLHALSIPGIDALPLPTPIQHPMSSGMALNQLWNTLGYLDPLPGFMLGRTRGRSSNHTLSNAAF
jgi:hypothetical protein